MLSAVWDYSRLPMWWVRNTKHAEKQLPWETQMEKKEKQLHSHPYRHVYLSGMAHHHFDLLFYYQFVILKPYRKERFCQVQQEICLMPRILGQKILKFSQAFPSFVQDGERTAGMYH